MSNTDRIARTGSDTAERRGLPDPERTGVGNEYPDERTMDDQPGLSGGEYPGAEEQTDVMSDDLSPAGKETTFGGRLGGYGPEGAIGTLDEGNTVDDGTGP